MRNGAVAGALATCVALLVSGANQSAHGESPYQVGWTRQLGTSGSDISYSVAVDASGNAYISGRTDASLGGPNTGIYDAFLSKYSSEGNVIWSRQFGTSGDDLANSVAVDASGNAYVSGYTTGGLGGTSAGGWDAFLVKYDGSGNTVWLRQIGTSSSDYGFSVAVDALGNAYITGETGGSLGGTSAGGADAFLAKYSSSGNVLWSRQVGTSSSDRSCSVAADTSGNVYVSGYTWGSLGGPNAGGCDAFLTKYSASGNLLWSRQIGTGGPDFSYSVAVDASGNAYITGPTWGDLGGPNAGGHDGGYDAFLTKYDAVGNLLWSRQIGTSSIDYSLSVAVDSLGNAYITGDTDGSLGGPSAGGGDAYLVKYDEFGNLLWSQQIGTPAEDISSSVAIDAAGNAYISGQTYGSLGDDNAGSADAFLVKFEIPEPATLSLLALGGLAILRCRRSWAILPIVLSVMLGLSGRASADTHAPWPSDWNNWSDPALWCSVGNPGNAPDTRYDPNGYGAVNYTYRMGKFEVTAGQYCQFLNAVAKTDTYGLYSTYMWDSDPNYGDLGCKIQRSGFSGSYTYSVASDWANRPVSYVSWGDAARFCNWVNNGQPIGEQVLGTTEDGAYYINGATNDAALLPVTRKGNARYVIPTEDEWYKAAYHKNDGVTGNYWDCPTRSNTGPGQDMNDLSGNNANCYTAPYAYPIDSGKYTTVVGEFQNSASPYGTFDQGGNVWEWNEAILYGLARGVRGRSFYNIGGSLYAADRAGASPSGEGAIGFRVSEVPQPCTLSLLALGGLAVLRHRSGQVLRRGRKWPRQSVAVFPTDRPSVQLPEMTCKDSGAADGHVGRLRGPKGRKCIDRGAYVQ